MILGRFIYGLGGECLNITSSIIMIVWFGGKELSFASVIETLFNILVSKSQFSSNGYSS